MSSFLAHISESQFYYTTGISSSEAKSADCGWRNDFVSQKYQEYHSDLNFY